MYDNRYLRDRAYRRSMRDGRNPYGSRGGYVSSKRSMRRDRAMDMEYDYPKYDSRYDSRYSPEHRGQDYHYGYEQHREYYRPMEHPMYDYNMRDYAHEDMEKEYKEDLHEWIEKLKKKDRFGLSKEAVIQKAKDMGVNFNEIHEMEYYAMYLAMVSDYPQISNDPHLYLAMAKDFIFDDDIQVSPSEKVCIYLYKIVLGE